MDTWVLNRWVRYGHDRLYAETAGGTRLGYLDMRTHTLHPAEPEDLPLLTAAVAGYLNRADDDRAKHLDSTPPPIPTPAQPAEIYVGRHAEADWVDLSDTAPGAAARERAIAERSAAPIRTTVARLLGVHTDERAWRIGADGEEAVAAQLSSLAPAWKVVHAVPVGENGADMDHVVIGPGGVFTVNAKHHPGATIWVGGNTFLVNGNRTHYVRNSRHEATRAGKLLSAQAGLPVDVTGIIAVMAARRGMTVKAQPADGKVVVVARREIAGYLASRPTVFAYEQVDALYELARRSTTWRPRTA